MKLNFNFIKSMIVAFAVAFVCSVAGAQEAVQPDSPDAVPTLDREIQAKISELSSVSCLLCFFAEKNNDERVSYLLDLRPEVSNRADAITVDINGQDGDERTALFWAVKNNNYEMAKRLLEDEIQPADPDIANVRGATPLMWAVRHDNGRMTDLLLNNDADTGIMNNIGHDAFGFAIRFKAANAGYRLLAEDGIVFPNPNTNASANVYRYIRDNHGDSLSRDLAVLYLARDKTSSTSFGGERNVARYAVANANGELLGALLDDGLACDYGGGSLSDFALEREKPAMITLLLSHDCASPSCPGGSVWSDGACPRTAEDCQEDGMILVDGECEACSEGYRTLDGMVCVVILSAEECLSIGKIYNAAEESCESCSFGYSTSDGIECLLAAPLGTENTFAYAAANNLTLLVNQLSEERTVNTEFGGENSILLWAARNDNRLLADALILDNAETDTLDHLNRENAFRVAVRSTRSDDFGVARAIKGGDAPFNTLKYALTSSVEIAVELANAAEAAADANFIFEEKPVVYYAADTNNLHLVNVLIDDNVDVNRPGFRVRGRERKISNALIQASALGYTAVVQALINADAELEERGIASGFHRVNRPGYGWWNLTNLFTKQYPDGGTALMWAAYAGHAGVVQALIDAGANLNAASDEGTALVWATQEWGQLDTVRILIDAGADVDAEGTDGRTALKNAAAFGNVNIIQALINAGVNVNFQPDNLYGSTALMDAAYHGHVSAVQALIDADADVDAKATNDYTALMYAAINGYVDAVQALIGAGADVNARVLEGDGDDYNGDDYTVLMIATYGGRFDVAQVLIDAGANVNAKGADGRTALMLAVNIRPDAYYLRDRSESGFELVKLLVNNGADITVQNEDGKTAIDIVRGQYFGYADARLYLICVNRILESDNEEHDFSQCES